MKQRPINAARFFRKVGTHVLVQGRHAEVQERDTISGFHMIRVFYTKDDPAKSRCEWVHSNRAVPVP